MTRAAAFTKSDITRLIRGARAAGTDVRRIEVDKATGNLVAEFGSLVDDAPIVNGDDAWSRAIRAKNERPTKKRDGV